jgi:hypothetical protein
MPVIVVIPSGRAFWNVVAVKSYCWKILGGHVFDSDVGVPYGSRTRVAAVKEKRFTGIQRKPAAWIAP